MTSGRSSCTAARRCSRRERTSRRWPRCPMWIWQPVRARCRARSTRSRASRSRSSRRSPDTHWAVAANSRWPATGGWPRRTRSWASLRSRWGSFRGRGGTQRLSRLIGPARAKDLVMSGRFVGAEEAVAIGLVDKVVPAEEVYDAAVAMVRAVHEGPGPGATGGQVGRGRRPPAGPGVRAGLGESAVRLPVRDRRPARGDGGVHREAQAGLLRSRSREGSSTIVPQPRTSRSVTPYWIVGRWLGLPCCVVRGHAELGSNTCRRRVVVSLACRHPSPPPPRLGSTRPSWRR